MIGIPNVTRKEIERAAVLIDTKYQMPFQLPQKYVGYIKSISEKFHKRTTKALLRQPFEGKTVLVNIPVPVVSLKD